MPSVWVQIIQPINILIAIAGWACLLGAWIKGDYKPDSLLYYNHLGSLIALPLWGLSVLVATFWEGFEKTITSLVVILSSFLLIFCGGVINYAIVAWEMPRTDYVLPNLSFAGVVLVAFSVTVAIAGFIAGSRREHYKPI